MFSAAFKMIRIGYRLFWIALVTITGGAWALAFHLVAFRLIAWIWRPRMRPPKQGSPPGARRNVWEDAL